MRVRLELRLKPVLAAHQAEVAIAAKGNIEKKKIFLGVEQKGKEGTLIIKNFIYVRSK